jgi:hypothetical protein
MEMLRIMKRKTWKLMKKGKERKMKNSKDSKTLKMVVLLRIWN